MEQQPNAGFLLLYFFFFFFFFHVCNHLLISHSHSHMKDLINCIYILFANNLS
jgi:hypothetical protein